MPESTDKPLTTDEWSDELKSRHSDWSEVMDTYRTFDDLHNLTPTAGEGRDDG